MFAVPGWSVSANNLKVEKVASDQSSKKRKRNAKEDEAVDTARLGELWTQHIEGKKIDGKSQSLSKKERKRSKPGSEESIETGQAGPALTSNGHATTQDEAKPAIGKHEDDKKRGNVATEQKNHIEASVKQDKIKDKKTKKEKKQKKDTRDQVPVVQQDSMPDDGQAAPMPSQTPPKLTPLQLKMREKLVSSRFRHLNETLYFNSSSYSLDLFKSNPEFFREYHEGFRRQAEAWPENPIDSFLKWISERGPVGMRNYKAIRRKTSRKPTENNQADQEDLPAGPDSLPRDPRKGICTIADLGCGDGKLGTEITKSSLQKKLKLKVLSYDLASSSPHITVADIKSLPLEDSSVDIAIFCLALMGTNWIDFIEEAYRVLRWKGECWIAEVASRFAAPKSKRVDHSVGNRTKDKAKPKGKPNGKPAEEDLADLGLALDANAAPQSNTDVSAFVAVLRRRGFVLSGEPDTRNRMFVQMRFIKALPPLRGKGVKQDRREGKKKFIEETDDAVTEEDEAKVLKPCVYKLR